MKDVNSYHDKLNLLNEQIDNYEQYKKMYSLDDTVETYYKAFKLNAKHFINSLFPNLLAIYEDISVHFDAWKSRIVYEINLLRLDPDYRVVIDFATKVWNFLAYHTKQLVLSYVFLGKRSSIQSVPLCDVLLETGM